MNIQDIKNLNIQTLADYDKDTKLFAFAVVSINENCEVIAREIKQLDEYAESKVRYIYTMSINGYLVSSEPDTLPNAKILKISYQIQENIQDNGNIELDKENIINISDLPLNAKNHFYKQIKEIQKALENKNTLIKIKNQYLPIVFGKCEYDRYKDNTIFSYGIFAQDKK